MDMKPLCHFLLPCLGIVGTANVAFAQASGNAPPDGASFEKIAIGVGVWLVTAMLAYVAWTLMKVVAKIGVFVLPILAGLAVAMLLPDKITSDAVVAIGVPWRFAVAHEWSPSTLTGKATRTLTISRIPTMIDEGDAHSVPPMLR